jgi:hypothetical protein
MPGLRASQLRAYRARTFHTAPGLQLTSLRQAERFIRERGFIHFWPIDGVDLPSLWQAVAGDRPVPSEHDDPAHVTWRWKDYMLDKRRWFYAKLLRGRSTMVSLQTLPAFYALSERLGDLDDYELAYEAGHLSREARLIGEALRASGPMHTIELRRRTRLDDPSAKGRFEKALIQLQKGLWILPVGVAEAGSWRYAFIFELLDRWLPDVFPEARKLTREQAGQELIEQLARSVGAVSSIQAARLFGWKAAWADLLFQELVQARKVTQLEDGRWMTERLLRGTPRKQVASRSGG